MIERKNNVFGIIALAISTICFLVNLAFFLPMLVEQVRIGEGTLIEMGALAVWLLNGLTIVPLIVSLIFTIISITKKDYLWKIIANILLISLTVIEMVLTTVFMFI